MFSFFFSWSRSCFLSCFLGQDRVFFFSWVLLSWSKACFLCLTICYKFPPLYVLFHAYILFCGACTSDVCKMFAILANKELRCQANSMYIYIIFKTSVPNRFKNIMRNRLTSRKGRTESWRGRMGEEPPPPLCTPMTLMSYV